VEGGGEERKRRGTAASRERDGLPAVEERRGGRGGGRRRSIYWRRVRVFKIARNAFKYLNIANNFKLNSCQIQSSITF
jgi:hypothetical protein